MGLRKTAFVSGVSMYPTLKDGDMIFFKAYIYGKTRISIGDIIILNHPLKNIILIKRIKSISKFGIEVSGDNKDFSSDSDSFGLVQQEKILGIYSTKISYLFFKRLRYLLNSQ